MHSAATPHDAPALTADEPSSASAGGEGTGLGLSMSHDIIVKQHGGKIDVQTEPGVSTEFIITLPRNSTGPP
jgi:signal transduction histidine kinase